MRREMTRLYLAVMVSVFAVLTTAGPANAVPVVAQPNAGTATTQVTTTAHGPAPATGHSAPAGAKAGPAGRARGGVQSAHTDGLCHWYTDGTGDLCLWHLPGFQGSCVGIYYSDPDLSNNYFTCPGEGQGEVVANNAASAWNYNSIFTAWVCADHAYGICAFLSPNSGGDLVEPWLYGIEAVAWA